MDTERVKTYDIKDHALRISAALYRVTDLFRDEEPLKWLLRKESVDVFSLIESLERDVAKKRDASFVNDMIERIKALIRSIQKKLALAEAGGFVSKLNFDVLGREYGVVHGALDSYRSSVTGDILDAMTHAFSLGENQQAVSLKGEEQSSIIPQNLIEGRAEKSSKKRANQKDMDQAKKGPLVINERQKEITEELGKKGGWLSARAFYDIFKGQYSEKTVQRDLNALVADGTLVSQGKKRWTRYALKSTRQNDTSSEGMDQVMGVVQEKEANSKDNRGDMGSDSWI